MMASNILTHFTTKPLSLEARFKTGKALRLTVPFHELGMYTPPLKRKDPVSVLEKQAQTRLPDLVPIRYARMLSSSFAFLRGAAAIMAGDLAGSKTTGIHVQTCGDLHIANFGVFASAERKLIFGINDFDETLPGPWEWDVKRLMASFVVCIRFLGGDDALCKDVIKAAMKSYRKHIRKYAHMGHLETWYATMTEEDILKAVPSDVRAVLKKLTDKARHRTNMQVLGKLTDLVDDKYRLKVNAPFIVRETHSQKGRPVREALGLLLESYVKSLADDRRTLLEQYHIVDAARKVVGVGSVGTRCWILFLNGSIDGDRDPLFLQVKEAQPSVLASHLGSSNYVNHGQRVVSGQRLIQGAPDIFLGWGQLDGIHFYIRQLRDMKGGPEFDRSNFNPDNVIEYCKLCAWAMALAHAKSGDAAMISGYAGKSEKLDDAMVRFAFAYADQNESDFLALKAAAKSKRIKVAKPEAATE
jgi:uncharacterized protein (DUF2252 family)